MEEPLTPSLRAEPLMIVSPTYREAAHTADDLGLHRQEWRHVREIRHVQGLRQGRYIFCGQFFPLEMMEIADQLKDPTLGFRGLPYDRVRKLVVRDRAAEIE